MKKSLILLFVMTLVLFQNNAFAQEKFYEVENQDLFQFLTHTDFKKMLEVENGSHFAKIFKVYSTEHISQTDGADERKTFYYILVADFGELPQGKLYKSTGFNYPELEVITFVKNTIKIKIRHKDSVMNEKEEIFELTSGYL